MDGPENDLDCIGKLLVVIGYGITFTIVLTVIDSFKVFNMVGSLERLEYLCGFSARASGYATARQAATVGTLVSTADSRWIGRSLSRRCIHLSCLGNRRGVGE